MNFPAFPNAIPIATGEPVGRAMLATEILEGEGIDCGVISMHTVKPFDAETLLDVVGRTKALITVEEHSIYGGIGEASAAILMQHGIKLPFRIVGIPDEYTVTGSQTEIFDHYGISADGLAKVARQLLEAGK